MSLVKLTRNAVCQYRRFYDLRNYAKYPRECPPHMNELPVPCGPWDPWYKDKQNNYNIILCAGIGWFLLSLGVMYYSGSVFFNWSPPALPGPPSDLECDPSES